MPTKWPNRPYGWGYVDFTPWHRHVAHLAQEQSATSGPPRTSIFDDIIWYWTKVASVEQVTAAQNDAAVGAIFLKKIVASMWNVFLEYIWARLCEFERSLGGFEAGKNRGYLLNTLSET